ncbi:hypothetical protein [Rhizobium sp. SSA_523]|uniref:hypothetical protein n=1 Tax=Rhizobium sp. SSA_523 TaxID=2952477 RepID=UPI002090250B|nr:hypothetical protein [Rhizobium sp. SSA_523]MCO5730248.1 hypothetical protein [Rhizobium sp. SSA_523]WKC25304.1 hypothetical protein QTJ18_15110 [Rhizobium sp. SSA_523]
MHYRLTCINSSNMHGNFVLYQRPERCEGSAHIRSLAWLSRPAAPGTRVTFSWRDSTSFVWGERVLGGNGGHFVISQSITADIDRDNLVDLKGDSFSAPTFCNLRSTPGAEGLTIRQLNAHFEYPLYHGIARGGAALMIAPFHVNVSTTFVVDAAAYWLHFNDCRAGEVLDYGQLDGSLRLDFGPARHSHSVMMGPDNIIRPTPDPHWH